MTLRNLPIGGRMTAAFGLIFLIFVLIQGFALVGNSRARDLVNGAMQQATEQAERTHAVRQTLMQLGIVVRNMGLQSTVDGVEAALVASRKAMAAYLDERKRLDGAGLGPEAGALLADLDRLVKELDRHFVSAVDLAQQFNTEQAAAVIMTRIDPLTARADQVLVRLTELQARQSAAARQAADEQARATLVTILLAGAGALGVAAWIAWALTRSVSLPLRQAVTMARAVAEGDLTRHAEPGGHDEPAQLLRALNEMTDRLATIVGQVRSSSDHIATGSAEIASGNADLSARTEQQAAALQQTASSMEQLGATVRQNALSSQQAHELADNARNVATRGGSVVSQVVETMKGISDSSRRIADIIGVIDGIAFQTNILALNAAVEAARAGEQGRGFAVVASEVRNLAQRSAEAAREIKSLIATSVERVEAGNGLVTHAGATMVEVVNAITSVNTLVAEISVASSQQSGGVTQVGQAVTQMDQTTQRNAALVEQSAAAAESLRQQAQQLVHAVAAFRLA